MLAFSWSQFIYNFSSAVINKQGNSYTALKNVVKMRLGLSPTNVPSTDVEK